MTHGLTTLFWLAVAGLGLLLIWWELRTHRDEIAEALALDPDRPPTLAVQRVEYIITTVIAAVAVFLLVAL